MATSLNDRLFGFKPDSNFFIEQLLATFPQQSHASYLLKWVDFIEKRTSVVVVRCPTKWARSGFLRPSMIAGSRRLKQTF